ncbi:hypothetical protein EB118_09000 [bacterium]|nr:hypothetical protein [bacterium]NDC94458.1 hypothetical protein [bacterium]NDD84432.1 hypothetical protein [bacterium]NDG30198.1 hypothetical protein [bacterium]
MDSKTLMQLFSNICEDSSESEKQNIANFLSTLNVNKRNEERIKSFTEKIIEKPNLKKTSYVKFLESASVNAIIWAPTQVGKSNASREFIETCFRYNVPVIVSTDNKTDQNEQLYTRIKNDLSGADVKLMKVVEKSFDDDFEKCLKSKNNRFVIFCLDNSYQIKKLTRAVKCLGFDKDFGHIQKFAILHDEADTVTKDNVTDAIHDDQAESHKKWIELLDTFNKKIGDIDLKRVFVTATPENCCMLYKIEGADLIKLEIPATYRGYKDISFNILEDDLDIKKVLEKEVKRIKADKTNEVILYCIDRKIDNGQNVVLHSLSSYLRCVVNTYNGHGITAFLHTIKKGNKFETQLKQHDIHYTREKHYFTIKDITIRKFYTLCKRIGENCVVTIGKDLISRGISYVSEDEHEPLTATTMIYKPGMTMHAVGITQTIGRITGCAMPELQRRLYAPRDVIETYRVYNINQEAYIKQIEMQQVHKTLTKDVISEMEFQKIKRHIDRVKLQLKMNYKNSHSNESESDIEQMKQLIDKWWGADTIIGKILRYLYSSENGVGESELRNFIKENGSKDSYQMYIHLTRADKEYSKVFEKIENVTRIKPEARVYIVQTK